MASLHTLHTEYSIKIMKKKTLNEKLCSPIPQMHPLAPSKEKVCNNNKCFLVVL